MGAFPIHKDNVRPRELRHAIEIVQLEYGTPNERADEEGIEFEAVVPDDEIRSLAGYVL
jgi:hypothetical protein